MLRSPAILLMLACATATAADTAFDDPRAEPEVEVDGYPVRAGGEIAFWDDALEVHPLGLAGIGWDAIGPPGEASASAFERVLGGVDATWHLDERDRIAVRLIGSVERYEDSERSNRFGGEASAVWRRRAPELESDLRLGIERSDEIPAQVGADVANVRRGGKASVALPGERNRVSLAALAERTDYLDGTEFFQPEQRDGAEIGGEAAYEVRTGEALGLRVRGKAGRRDYDLHDVFQDRAAWEAAAAVRCELGERSFLLAEAGWESWRMAGDFRNDPARDDARADLLGGTIAARLSWEQGSHIEISAGRHLSESLTANAALGQGVALLGRMRLSERSQAWLRFEANRQQDLAEASSAGPPLEDRRTVEARLVGEWTWERGLVVRPRILAIDSRSDAGGDYRRLQAALEAVVAW